MLSNDAVVCVFIALRAPSVGKLERTAIDFRCLLQFVHKEVVGVTVYANKLMWSCKKRNVRLHEGKLLDGIYIGPLLCQVR